MSEQVDVELDEARQRFVVTVDGVRAGYAGYELDGAVATLAVTVVDPAFGGRGLATRLADAAFEHARTSGWSVVPACSFMAAHVDKHPELADLVAR
ncbi:GNAT family N-acetyltransferase [Nocardioides sp. GY 10127]|uniref:GNAT family N-acetyltransferase n=1 Tax=Nocardioides sp. GY 10127 TaxID=2569762 RepID=UPI0010A88108|nr:GNAT family N-acetyltransferase [Nocardioides sp. GY 10127]TIC86353.1 N-acetyltransferase [Nocardioides sp. GY 10127]